MADAARILEEALSLAADQRARIAHELIASLDESPPDDPEAVAKAWDDEIARRVDDVRSGRVKTVPWSAVKKEMSRAIKSVRARRRRTRGQ